MPTTPYRIGSTPNSQSPRAQNLDATRDFPYDNKSSSRSQQKDNTVAANGDVTTRSQYSLTPSVSLSSVTSNSQLYYLLPTFQPGVIRVNEIGTLLGHSDWPSLSPPSPLPWDRISYQTLQRECESSCVDSQSHSLPSPSSFEHQPSTKTSSNTLTFMMTRNGIKYSKS